MEFWAMEKNELEFILGKNESIDSEMLLDVIVDSESYKAFLIKFSGEDGKEEIDSIYRINGNTAEIDIKGELVNQEDFFSMLFGREQTTYGAIQTGLMMAESNPAIDKIQLNIDSHGGELKGVDRTAELVRGSKKNITASIDDCCSAAYWIASQADSIESVSKTGNIGSIGILAVAIDRSERLKKDGIKKHTIVSSQAPRKGDIDKEEVRNNIQENLDDLHMVFVEAVAAGRGTTANDVLDNYGRGGYMTPDKALAAGMIDKIISNKNINSKNNSNFMSKSNPEGEIDGNEKEEPASLEHVEENPYPGEHSLRIKEPGTFDPKSFRRLNDDPKKLGPGKKPIDKIIGKPKGKSAPGDPTKIQAFRFRVKYWTIEQVRNWIKEKGWIRGKDYISLEPAKKESKDSENKGGKFMNIEELKGAHPELHAELIREGMEQGKALGVEAERARIIELTGWSDKHPACKKLVGETIANGKTCTEIMSDLCAIAMSTTTAAAAAENPDDLLQVGAEGTPIGSGADGKEKELDDAIELAAQARGMKNG